MRKTDNLVDLASVTVDRLVDVRVALSERLVPTFMLLTCICVLQ